MLVLKKIPNYVPQNKNCKPKQLMRAVCLLSFFLFDDAILHTILPPKNKYLKLKKYLCFKRRPPPHVIPIFTASYYIYNLFLANILKAIEKIHIKL